MDIYLITCLKNNKKYIGQCSQYIGKNNRKYGYKKRYQQHKSKGSKCILLRNAIQKYGKNNFKIECLLQCGPEISDYYEKKFIKVYDTLYPNGYNLETGGNKLKKLSKETRSKMSKVKMGHKPYFNMTEDIRLKISNNLSLYYKENPKYVKDHNGKILPKYISPVIEKNEIIGYCINNHITGFRKKITSKKKTLDEKLKEISKFLE